MQLYAFDSSHSLILAREAQRQQDYFCSECQSIVRLRKGLHKQPHFFHVDPNRLCRSHRKGPIHHQLQLFFLNLLPPNECILEYRCPQIDRIADVAWIPKKIVFEIQYSGITSEEMHQRNRDYERLGWQVVWILHDHRYNKYHMTEAELYIRSFPHYFSNMDEYGHGKIYDQFDIVRGSLRLFKMNSFIFDISAPLTLKSNIKCSLRKWKGGLYFKGDLFDLHQSKPRPPYIRQAIKKRWVERFKDCIQLTQEKLISALSFPYDLLCSYFYEKTIK